MNEWTFGMDNGRQLSLGINQYPDVFIEPFVC